MCCLQLWLYLVTNTYIDMSPSIETLWARYGQGNHTYKNYTKERKVSCLRDIRSEANQVDILDFKEVWPELWALLRTKHSKLEKMRNVEINVYQDSPVRLHGPIKLFNDLTAPRTKLDVTKSIDFYWTGASGKCGHFMLLVTLTPEILQKLCQFHSVLGHHYADVKFPNCDAQTLSANHLVHAMWNNDPWFLLEMNPISPQVAQEIKCLMLGDINDKDELCEALDALQLDDIGFSTLLSSMQQPSPRLSSTRKKGLRQSTQTMPTYQKNKTGTKTRTQSDLEKAIAASHMSVTMHEWDKIDIEAAMQASLQTATLTQSQMWHKGLRQSTQTMPTCQKTNNGTKTRTQTDLEKAIAASHMSVTMHKREKTDIEAAIQASLQTATTNTSTRPVRAAMPVSRGVSLLQTEQSFDKLCYIATNILDKLCNCNKTCPSPAHLQTIVHHIRGEFIPAVVGCTSHVHTGTLYEDALSLVGIVDTSMQFEMTPNVRQEMRSCLQAMLVKFQNGLVSLICQ